MNVSTDDIVREFERRNFRHVNDTTYPLGELSESFSQAVVDMAIERQALEARVKALTVALKEAKLRCEWYHHNGTDQERLHFVAVELVHDFEQALEQHGWKG